MSHFNIAAQIPKPETAPFADLGVIGIEPPIGAEDYKALTEDSFVDQAIVSSIDVEPDIGNPFTSLVIDIGKGMQRYGKLAMVRDRIAQVLIDKDHATNVDPHFVHLYDDDQTLFGGRKSLSAAALAASRVSVK